MMSPSNGTVSTRMKAKVVIVKIDGVPLESNCIIEDEGQSSRDAEVDGMPLGHLHPFYKFSMGYKDITSFSHPKL